MGRRWEEKLHTLGVRTVGDFIKKDPLHIRRKMGVVGERILWELRGTSCLSLEEPAPKQSLTCSRSFGRPVTLKSELAEALATFAATACGKLRAQKYSAQAVCIFLETTLQEGLRHYFNRIVHFPSATQDTMQVITAAKEVLQRIYRPKEAYKKCGIILLDLIDEQEVIPDLFVKPMDPRRSTLMHAVDTINAHFGKNTLFFGAMGVNPKWTARCDRRSKHYTTDWNDLYPRRVQSWIWGAYDSTSKMFFLGNSFLLFPSKKIFLFVSQTL